jgi:acetylornithine deacetylase/succinyl-diaminopimelate desuccinylase-like protein
MVGLFDPCEQLESQIGELVDRDGLRQRARARKQEILRDRSTLPGVSEFIDRAAELGLAVGGEYAGGSADSGFTAAVGAPTLCGTGPIGEKAHSPDEACHLDTLVPRAQALALAIARLPA